MIIDLNCDMGELPSAIEDGTQEALLQWITSANVACGGHAGDEASMLATIDQALRAKVAIGAHPGYADRKNFGRTALDIPLAEVTRFVFEQVKWLAVIAERRGAVVTHVKPHGALYNQAVHNRALAEAIAHGVAQCNRDLVLVGLAGSPMLDVFGNAGFAVAAEAFADRRYEPDGTLRARSFRDALIHDPSEAAQQALRIATSGTVATSDGGEIAVQARTICIHGDTPGAPDIAAAVAASLRDGGVILRPLSSQ